MATSTVVNVNGKWYVADASGCLTPIPKNGWVLAGSDYYYAEDGGLVTNEIRKINGAYYAFDNDGKMLANGYMPCACKWKSVCFRVVSGCEGKLVLL